MSQIDGNLARPLNEQPALREVQPKKRPEIYDYFNTHNSSFLYEGEGKFMCVDEADPKSVDYIESMWQSGKIVTSDLFLLEAVSFFGHADRNMVYEGMQYLKRKYPNRRLPSDIEDISSRLKVLASSGLLWRRAYEQEGKKAKLAVYTPCYRGYNAYNGFLEKNYSYNEQLIYNSTPKMLRILHSGEVACRLSKIINKKAKLVEWANLTKKLTVAKGYYAPTSYIKAEYNNNMYNFLIEPAHFAVDDSIETFDERKAKFDVTLTRMVSARETIKQNMEYTYFIFTIGDLKDATILVNMFNKYDIVFADHAFITTDKAMDDTKGVPEKAFLKAIYVEGHGYKLSSCKPGEIWFV